MTATAQPGCLRRPLLRPWCLRAAVARRVMESVARRVPIDVAMPDGSLLGRDHTATAPGDRPVLEIVRPRALFERLAHHPKIDAADPPSAPKRIPLAGTTPPEPPRTTHAITMPPNGTPASIHACGLSDIHA